MTDQEIIIAQQRELTELRSASERAAKSAAIAGALAGHNLVGPQAADQIARLIDDQVQVHRDANGASKATGPAFQDLASFIGTRLQTDLSHFVKTGSAPAGQTRAAGLLPESDPTNETLSSRVIRAAAERRAAAPAGDGRTNPGLAFGLKGTRS